MKRLILSVTALAAVLFGSQCDQVFASARVALVMGNSNYQSATALPNPKNDAKAIASLLRSLGFDVTERTDLTRRDMASAIFEFSEKSVGADAAIFFYAGHGIQMDGKNYLIPIDGDIKNEMDVKLGSAIDLDTAIDKAMSDAKIKIVLLDACRDNPFAAQIQRSLAKTRSTTIVGRGLAEVRIGSGTIVAYATAPGQTALDGEGANSPFTTALVKHLGEPNLEIQLAMTSVRGEVEKVTQRKQVPWTNTNLSGFFYLNPAAEAQKTRTEEVVASAPPPHLASVPTGGNASNEIEMEYWRSVKDSQNVGDLEAYLAKFPNGYFADIARSRIVRITGAPPSPKRELAALQPPQDNVATSPAQSLPLGPGAKLPESSQQVEGSLALTTAIRRGLEVKLTRLGYYSGAISGDFNTKLRAGLSKWQSEHGYPETGYLNKLQYDTLSALEVPEPRPAPRNAVNDDDDRGRKGKKDKKRSYSNRDAEPPVRRAQEYRPPAEPRGPAIVTTGGDRQGSAAQLPPDYYNNYNRRMGGGGVGVGISLGRRGF